jgi:serine/threonine protein kinase/tetratricopeptide (TPR) repeat protein
MTQLPQHSKDLTQIGHYTILSSIGRGGMGLVYLARDTRLDRQVAIKCLRTELFEPHYRARFKREALLLAKLNHPHIVQIYDYLETDEQLALVMEYVNGQNLQQHLRENIVPLTQRMQWLTHIAQGLAVAHDAGIIHRDLKAENILINQHKLAKITDLGIAKSQDFNATLTDHVTGSYGSMSPEQAMGEELDFRSDLFSFGILAYQLLCGAHPFGETENKLQLMQRIISHPPIPPTKKNPDLPSEAVQLLGQLLSKNPDNRPANTHWVAAQCEKLYQLSAANSVADTDNTEVLQQSQSGYSGIRKTSARNTQEHPTFETRLEKSKPSFFKAVKTYITERRNVFALASALLLMITGVTIWQLQPKPPRYVAVLLPNLTANGMQESQQELVKGAVYDAIQQSVLQLDGYYLIPHNEIADINAANNKEGIENVRRATAADELITTDIQCKIEACTITLTRLTPDGKKQEGRLRVQDTKTVDVLTDNYLSVATIVQSNVGGLYSEDIGIVFKQYDEKEYAAFLEANRSYRDKGASQDILAKLDALSDKTKGMAALQTLYTDVSLDLHNETKDSDLLIKLQKIISLDTKKKSNTTKLYNSFYLQIAQENYLEASKTITLIETTHPNDSSKNELLAYKMMAQKDYLAAIEYYQKSLASKKTTNTLYYLAFAYWYSGNMVESKKQLTSLLTLSPNLYKAHRLYGVISLLSGDLDQAVRSFEKSSNLQKNDTFSLGNLGLCYLLEKKYHQALDIFNHISELAPQNITTWLNIADTENLAGNLPASKLIYEKIVNAINPEKTNSENLRSLIQAYSHLGKHTEALRLLQQLERSDSQNIETTYTAAITHTLANNKSSAILYVESALKNNMSRIWFTFSWFNSLCSESQYIRLMQKYGEPEICSPR